MMLRLSVVAAVAVLVGLVCAAKAEEELPQPSQEALGLLASLQQASEGSRDDLRDAAGMYELLQLAAMQQQQQQQRRRQQRPAEPEDDAFPMQPHAGDRLFFPPPFDRDDYLKDKRGSYMSLCHFKICNMGRKRSSFWNTWGRN